MQQMMKQLLFILLLSAQAIHAQGGFERGNDAYRKGKYSEAVSEYENILNTKKQSAELYFNLANAYYKQHKVAPSIFNYEKALQLAPHDNDIRTNLEFARKLAIDDIKETPKTGFEKMLGDLASTYHYDTWAWIAVAFSFAFLAFFIGYYFSSTTLYKRIFFIAMFLAILVSAVSAGSGFFTRNIYLNDRPAIVFAEISPVKSEPKEEAQDAFVLHEGAKVHVLENLDNWRKVELPDGTNGWIDAAAIKEIK